MTRSIPWFALQRYDASGGYVVDPKKSKEIDTSGKLPTGEAFEDFAGLKKILTTSQREAVIRNVVERFLSYALCRKLEIYDRPAVEGIVDDLVETNGTYRDLIGAVANSLPFRETIYAN